MSILQKPSPLQVIFIRTCATDLDDQSRITGALDLPLSRNGITQAESLASELCGHSFKVIYASNCLAANQTANVISKKCGVKVRTEESWTNLDHGLWHGKCLEELKENQPKLYRQWQETPESVCPPGGETFEDVEQRIAGSAKRILKKHKKGVIAVVAPEPLYSILQLQFELAAESEPLPVTEDNSRWQTFELAGAF